MIKPDQILGSHTWWQQVVTGLSQAPVFEARFHVLIVVCACCFILPGCSRSPAPAPNPGSTEARTTAFTTPPFSTKEPDRYQAIRITSITETTNSENVSSSESHQVSIARDGEKRREEYAGATERIVHLEIPAGRFIVLPASRIYADLSNTAQETDQGKGRDFADSPELSPDRLLNEAHAPATYEKIGTETLAGRSTTKYRVVVLTRADSQNETLIWIDEALGIPVRSETISKSIGHSSKVTMELKDIKLEVDAGLFSWPSDYRKVEARVIFDLARKEGKPAAKRGKPT